jgi:hypothetical protein
MMTASQPDAQLGAARESAWTRSVTKQNLISTDVRSTHMAHSQQKLPIPEEISQAKSAHCQLVHEESPDYLPTRASIGMELATMKILSILESASDKIQGCIKAPPEASGMICILSVD